MVARSLMIGSGVLVLALACWCVTGGAPGQDAAPPGDAPPPVPRGVDVQAHGPIHEAYAPLTADPVPTKAIAKQPPKPLEEMPPEDKPEGNATWIPGYWAWDDDRSDFLWVSGCWRVPPPGQKWVAGYWREDTGSSQWVPGFWTAAAAEATATAAPGARPIEQVTYLPQPPAPPAVEPPGPPPNLETFYVPGGYAWMDGRYVWRAGYWARVQPGYVWVPAHMRWTPTGYVYINGYWDLAISRRGVLYAPVIIDQNVVGVNYVYTPAYAIHDTLVIDSLFVRPAYCHYYFGDYYGPAYRDYGFESCVIYSRGHYDGIIVYETYQHRSDPTWLNVQITLHNDRFAGRAPLPSRAFVGNRGLVSSRELAASRGTRVERLEPGQPDASASAGHGAPGGRRAAAPGRARTAVGAAARGRPACRRDQARGRALARRPVTPPCANQEMQRRRLTPPLRPRRRTPPLRPRRRTRRERRHREQRHRAPNRRQAKHHPARHPPDVPRRPTAPGSSAHLKPTNRTNQCFFDPRGIVGERELFSTPVASGCWSTGFSRSSVFGRPAKAGTPTTGAGE